MSERSRQEPVTGRKKIFPDDFQWGVATSAFQLEGSPHADWTDWDAILGEKPGITGHYSMYREDLALLKQLNRRKIVVIGNDVISLYAVTELLADRELRIITLRQGFGTTP